jgi:hypothetical protein
LGYFVCKILRQKITFFPILGGARAGCAHPTGPAPDMDGAHENESHKLCVSSVRRSYKK